MNSTNSTPSLDSTVIGGDKAIIKQYLTDSRQSYSRAYYLRNKARKKQYYDEYYRRNKEMILKNQQLRKRKIPSCFNKITREIKIDFN